MIDIHPTRLGDWEFWQHSSQKWKVFSVTKPVKLGLGHAFIVRAGWGWDYSQNEAYCNLTGYLTGPRLPTPKISGQQVVGALVTSYASPITRKRTFKEMLHNPLPGSKVELAAPLNHIHASSGIDVVARMRSILESTAHLLEDGSDTDDVGGESQPKRCRTQA